MADRQESAPTYRVGDHYGIHVYEDQRPVATFHSPADAARFVDLVNASLHRAEPPPPSTAPSASVDLDLVASVRSTLDDAKHHWMIRLANTGRFSAEAMNEVSTAFTAIADSALATLARGRTQ